MEFLKSITRKAALEIIDAFPLNPKMETVDIENALDRVLAEDIISEEDIPPFSRSLVDGFAVKAKDTYGAKETSPLFLTVSGRVEIGQETDIILDDGHCAGISTGAMIPEGTDGIVMEEYIRRLPDAVEVTKTVHKGENICFRGEDITKGNMVLKKGKKLSPFDIGILSALGIKNPPVFKKPEIAVISSGDEITAIDEIPPPGKIRDINRYTVSNLLRKESVNITFVGIARDSIDEITEKLLSAQKYDVILISGGSSKGERDYITDAIEKLGGKILFHGVNIKPGKPTIFGKLWDKPIFGLPGHPNSCIMAVIRFVLPLLQRLKGELLQDSRRIKAALTTNVPSSYGIEEYARVSIEVVDGTYQATPIFAKSSVISSLALAPGYIIIPESTEGYEKDEEVEVYFF
jgi:molybdopterin molybdotransferase